MTNREKFKDELDAMLATLMAVVDGKPVICDNASCSECFFEENCGWDEDIIDWLDSEYQEPPTDWSKVPIDTPVLVSNDGEIWYRRHFAGIDGDGNPKAFFNGMTSWSISKDTVKAMAHQYMKLAEGNE